MAKSPLGSARGRVVVRTLNALSPLSSSTGFLDHKSRGLENVAYFTELYVVTVRRQGRG